MRKNEVGNQFSDLQEEVKGPDQEAQEKYRSQIQLGASSKLHQSGCNRDGMWTIKLSIPVSIFITILISNCWPPYKEDSQTERNLSR